MKESVNIMCLYWVGKFRGRDFTPEDVWALKNNVDRYIDRPYTFYVLTNDMDADLPGLRIPLKHNWEGWWSKMELHRDDLPKGRTLYMDLDSHIVRSLQPILDYEGDLVMFDTRTPLKKQITRPEKGWVYRYQAATMLFDPGCQKDMYARFCKDADHWMSVYRSDQDVMGAWIPDQPTFPHHWMIKLATCKTLDKLPHECIIVTGRIKDGRFRDLKEAPWLQEAINGSIVGLKKGGEG